jgi:hypothetical protein
VVNWGVAGMFDEGNMHRKMWDRLAASHRGARLVSLEFCVVFSGAEPNYDPA